MLKQIVSTFLIYEAGILLLYMVYTYSNGAHNISIVASKKCYGLEVVQVLVLEVHLIMQVGAEHCLPQLLA